jgi:DNA-nicking Smr family endonuclease
MPNKYSQEPESTLDLHQLTKQESKPLVLEFLKTSEQEGLSIIRIIVGKGLHSKVAPVLGGYVRSLLREQDYDYRDAKVSQGSEGAIDIKL